MLRKWRDAPERIHHLTDEYFSCLEEDSWPSNAELAERCDQLVALYEEHIDHWRRTAEHWRSGDLTDRR